MLLSQVAILFRNHRDLLEEFTYFLPDAQAPAQVKDSSERAQQECKEIASEDASASQEVPSAVLPDSAASDAAAENAEGPSTPLTAAEGAGAPARIDLMVASAIFWVVDAVSTRLGHSLSLT